MERVLRVWAGFLVGAGLAAAVVLLLTPRSGAETQQLIRERIQAILAEGREAADTKRLELTARFEDLKQPLPPSTLP